jgi:hypothetical protein
MANKSETYAKEAKKPVANAWTGPKLAGAAAESSAAIAPEARVAFAEVDLAGTGVTTSGLELPRRGRDAVRARLGAEVPDVLRHGLHAARSTGKVPSARRRCSGAERRVPHRCAAGAPPHFLNRTVVSCLPRNESLPYRTKQARSCTAPPVAQLQREESLEMAEWTQPVQTEAGRSERHW